MITIPPEKFICHADGLYPIPKSGCSNYYVCRGEQVSLTNCKHDTLTSSFRSGDSVVLLDSSLMQSLDLVTGLGLLILIVMMMVSTKLKLEVFEINQIENKSFVI